SHRAPTFRTVGLADPGVQDAEVVVDLSDGAHGRPRVLRGGLLVDRDGRRQPFDEVDVGLLHLTQELARVGGQRLHVAAMTLGVDGVEGQRALAGARETREHDQLSPGKVEGDVLQVVLSGTVNYKPVSAHGGILARPSTDLVLAAPAHDERPFVGVVRRTVGSLPWPSWRSSRSFHRRSFTT